MRCEIMCSLHYLELKICITLYGVVLLLCCVWFIVFLCYVGSFRVVQLLLLPFHVISYADLV